MRCALGNLFLRRVKLRLRHDSGCHIQNDAVLHCAVGTAAVCREGGLLVLGSREKGLKVDAHVHNLANLGSDWYCLSGRQHIPRGLDNVKKKERAEGVACTDREFHFEWFNENHAMAALVLGQPSKSPRALG